MRKSKGRQKVEMVKMANESNLQVTFSKRRSGLFKKASELCTLCGVEVAIVVFSPGKKVFSFGHPSVEALVDRFFSRSPPQSSTTTTMQLLEAHRNATVHDLNMQLTQVQNQLESEKKRGDELNEERKYWKNQCWWAAPIEELTSTQLQQLKVSLEDLKKSVTKQAEKVLFQTHNSQHFVASNNNYPFELKPTINVGFNGNPNMNINMMLPPPAPLLPQLQNLPPPPPLSHGFNLGFGRGFY